MKCHFIVLLLLLPFFSSAQNQNALSYPRKNLNKKGMLVLGGWAVANIATGSIAYPNTSGSTRYFHQMNMFWNVANLGIATIGLLTDRSGSTSWQEEYSAQRKTEKLFLINGGLDVAYIATGIYLHKRGIKKENSRLNGYGKSIVLQGAFLLAFDGVMYTLNRKNSRKMSMVEDASIGFTGNGVGLQFTLK